MTYGGAVCYSLTRRLQTALQLRTFEKQSAVLANMRAGGHRLFFRTRTAKPLLPRFETFFVFQIVWREFMNNAPEIKRGQLEKAIRP